MLGVFLALTAKFCPPFTGILFIFLDPFKTFAAILIHYQWNIVLDLSLKKLKVNLVLSLSFSALVEIQISV